MECLTKSQLLEYITAKRDFFLEEHERYRAVGNDIMAEKMWQAYDSFETIHLFMTNSYFARFAYTYWTGKEL